MSETVPPPAGPETTDSAPQQDTEPPPNHHTPAATVSVSSNPSQNVPSPSNPPDNSSHSVQPPQAQPPVQQQPQQHLSQHMDPVHQLQHYQPPSSNPQATMNENQLNLPSIQSIESHPQNHQIPQAHSQAPIVSSTINNPMNMPPPNIPQYYTMAGPISSPDPYPMVGEPNRGLSSGRHKKEVKRRTKTGCLTCRKRRIKCDERHPVCRNCEKSKRDCLGYDPVFRPQPGPSALQPAPSQPSLLVSHQGTPSYMSSQSPLAGGQSFAHPHLPTTSPSSSPSVHQFDYGTAIDPALEGVASPNAATHNTSEGDQTPASTMYGTESLELKPVKVIDLLSVRGHFSPPPAEITTIPPPRIEEIKLVYISYAVAIDRFLECNWFETKGMIHLLANPRLLSYYSALLDGFNDRNIHDPAVLARVESLEASVIWETLTLTRIARSKEPDTNGNGTGTHTTDVELLYAVKRLAVFEALITGSHLETNPVSLDSYPECDPAHRLPGIGNQIKAREIDFWESVGRYLTVSQDVPDAQKQKELALTTCRGLLDTFENRDVIYSIVIVRHIAKFQPRKLKQTTASTDEKDAAAKLYVAVRFLEDESHGKGTNQVIKRLCGMVVKYWEDSHGTS
ncbi:transcriptional regulatory protein moc3 [Emergomyces pasteurianus Ep9510]|uniref:Transcriptional regulatory protein moc3 n=1 Tax=Emergomyces pasteurianus Ep9510 TaxID=1447872 RepID=A0A1J9PHT2_9EURO|nr:transcriptional regulatory protein moc3 [Emergomyces pasteurianus Ep9510]